MYMLFQVQRCSVVLDLTWASSLFRAIFYGFKRTHTGTPDCIASSPCDELLVPALILQPIRTSACEQCQGLRA